jgi:hypothetical protein
LFLKIFIFHRLQQCFGFDLFCVLVCCSSFPAEIFAASKISFSLLGLADAGGVLHESCAPSRRPVLSLFLRCLSISAANPAARVCLQFSIFPAGRWTLVCLPVFPLPLVESTAAKRQDQFFGPLRFGPCPGFNFTAGVQIRFEPQPCSSLPPKGSSAARLQALRVSTFRFCFARVTNQNSFCHNKLLIVRS